MSPNNKVDALSNRYDTIDRRTNVFDILADAQAARFVIQDFRPLAESIEWELGQAFYERGSQAFAGDRPIPFAINNDGNLSLEAADLLFTSLETSDEGAALEPEIFALEYREGLLRKQSEVLQKLASRFHQQGQRMLNRVTDITGPSQISTSGAQK